MTREGADEDRVLDLIRSVRGIHATLSQAAGPDDSHRLQLLQLELPLLGGRLWAPDEAGRRNDRDWIALVASRIRQYRARAADLRAAVERCVTDEDYVRLARDIEGVKRQLLERLGLRRVELSAMERELVGTVASVEPPLAGGPPDRGRGRPTGLWRRRRRETSGCSDAQGGRCAGSAPGTGPRA